MGNVINPSMDFQTRFEKRKEISKERILAGLAGGATVGAAGVAGSVLLKDKSAQDTFVKIIDKTATKTGKGLAKLFPKLKPALKKMGEKFAELPGWAKIAGAIMWPTVAILEHISQKLFYTSGRIDQKYEDLAKMKQK